MVSPRLPVNFLAGTERSGRQTLPNAVARTIHFRLPNAPLRFKG